MFSTFVLKRPQRLLNQEKCRRTILHSKTSTATEVLAEIGEVSGTPSGAESLARELGDEGAEAIRVLRSALLRVRHSSSTNPPPVSTRELRLVALEACVPFVGFGFIDNAGMITFGDAIDNSLGVVLGVSTLTSAALGNMVSDILGIGLGGAVAHFATRLGLPTATLTLEQTMTKSVRRARTIGSTIGVIIGCCLGMFPLLLIDDGKAERLKRQRALDELFVKAVKYIANDALDAETATLYVIDWEKQEIWTRESKELRFPLSKAGLVGQCAREGLQINSTQPSKEANFNAEIDTEDCRNILCTPVFDRHGKVTAVIEVINKKTEDSHFTEQDARVLAGLASHVSVALDEVHRSMGWLSAIGESNPLMNALKTHRQNYVRFATDSVSKN